MGKTIQGDRLEPNADYFTGVLFTRLMGNAVFDTATPDSKVQAYAHCSRQSKGGLAVALINFDTKERTVHLNSSFLSSTSSRVDFIMTAESAALGQYAKLNGGQRLTSAAGLVGVKGTGNIVTLPAQSCGAVNFPNAAVSHCSPSPPSPPSPPVPP